MGTNIYTTAALNIDIKWQDNSSATITVSDSGGAKDLTTYTTITMYVYEYKGADTALESQVVTGNASGEIDFSDATDELANLKPGLFYYQFRGTTAGDDFVLVDGVLTKE